MEYNIYLFNIICIYICFCIYIIYVYIVYIYSIYISYTHTHIYNVNKICTIISSETGRFKNHNFSRNNLFELCSRPPLVDDEFGDYTHH